MTNKLLILLYLMGIATIQAQTKTITGIVTDKDGPLPGSRVQIEGTDKVVYTDFDGKYGVEVEQGDILTYTYLGFKTERKMVQKNTSVLNIRLKEGDSILDEFIVRSNDKKWKSEDCPGTKQKGKVMSAYMGEKRITGRVSDKKKALRSVRIQIEGTDRKVFTDANGNYCIKATGGHMLIFSFTGYKTVRREVIKSISKMNVKMNPKNALSEE